MLARRLLSESAEATLKIAAVPICLCSGRDLTKIRKGSIFQAVKVQASDLGFFLGVSTTGFFHFDPGSIILTWASFFLTIGCPFPGGLCRTPAS
jgi:hypothetical protein